MEEALRALLLGNAGLAAAIGTKVNWATRPQGVVMPDVVLHLIDDVPRMNLTEPSGWSAARVQIDAWARTHKAARDIANIIAAPAAQGGMNGYRGTASGIRLRTFVIDRESDTSTDSQGVVHRTRLDLNVWWNPA